MSWSSPATCSRSSAPASTPSSSATPLRLETAPSRRTAATGSRTLHWGRRISLSPSGARTRTAPTWCCPSSSTRPSSTSPGPRTATASWPALLTAPSASSSSNARPLTPPWLPKTSSSIYFTTRRPSLLTFSNLLTSIQPLKPASFLLQLLQQLLQQILLLLLFQLLLLNVRHGCHQASA